MGWLLLIGGLIGYAVSVRIGRSHPRGIAQGFAVLAAAAGGLLLLRRPGSSLLPPGYGPRQWHRP